MHSSAATHSLLLPRCGGGARLLLYGRSRPRAAEHNCYSCTIVSMPQPVPPLQAPRRCPRRCRTPPRPSAGHGGASQERHHAQQQPHRAAAQGEACGVLPTGERRAGAQAGCLPCAATDKHQWAARKPPPQELGVRSWPTWGCEASKFPWSYDSTGEAWQPCAIAVGASARLRRVKPPLPPRALPSLRPLMPRPLPRMPPQRLRMC